MSADTPICIQLDEAREVRWTMRADVRLSSLDYDTRRAANELGKPRRALFAMCAFLWAALQDRDHPFHEPSDLGVYLEGDEKQAAAMKAIREMLDQAGLLGDVSKKKPVDAVTTSENGRSPSSN